MKVSTIPASKGPGRYKATTEIMSSKDVINGWSIIKGSKMENIK